MDYRIERALKDLEQNGLLVSIGGEWSDLPADCTLKSDSRTIGSGDIFACVCGLHSDGHAFIPQAIAGGAVGLIVQKKISVPLPWICCKDVRAAMGYVAAALNGEPAETLKMFAVTGTQGKSTTSYMVRSILQSCGVKCGLLGTIVYDDGASAELADRTTPESDGIQNFLKRMVDNGCQACSMECSSHGIIQGRISGCRFDGAIFTNLTAEHLDFHGTMENYFDAKATLFRKLLKNEGVIAPNVGNFYGRKLAEEFQSAVTWGIEVPARVRGENIKLDTGGGEFDLSFDGRKIGHVKVPLTGKYNLENALGAAALCLAWGCDEKKIIEGLENIPQVPGRMERLDLENGVRVIIDYAHTADSLEAILQALKPLAKRRLVSVFGHGGERFEGHRPLLGRAAGKIADRIFVTMDNPRREDPVKIAAQIVEGIKKVRSDNCWQVVLPRKAAVRKALDFCKSGDLLVLSGKGPEPYLEIGGVKHPYSDKEAVIEWARKKGMKVR